MSVVGNLRQPSGSTPRPGSEFYPKHLFSPRKALPASLLTSSTAFTPLVASRASPSTPIAPRQDCSNRDPNCQICNAKGGDVSHIIPYSVNFWKFVELFRGDQAANALKAIALAPNPEYVDNLKNVWTLCKTCHQLLGHGQVAIIPDLDGLTPFDPSSTSTYTATIEFPCGSDGIGIASWRHEANGRVRLVRQIDKGDVITLSTDNAFGLPLPHPLLSQLHALISRVIGMKAAAGFRTFPGRDRGSADDYRVVPAFVDTTYLHWLEHQDKSGWGS